MKKKIISLVMVAVLALSLMGCSEKKDAPVYEVNHSLKAETSAENLLSGVYKVLIDVENYGEIVVELDADSAPITVTNFMKLVHEDFYSGLTFHRIIKGFMMQGGQSNEKKAANIKGEFITNGIDNPISHLRGVISMARANDPNSADSQFFICHEDSTYLDGAYAAFGHVVSGMDVVDRICEEAVVIDNNGTVPPEYQPVIKSITDITNDNK